jgi:muramoyltetrapeptide carboxypeptidase
VIIKPPRLKPGDKISIIAPAGPVTPSELIPGISHFASMGYEVHVSKHIYEKTDYLAGNDDVRLEDLHYVFEDGGIRAIFCGRGGYGTLRLLDKIDYGLIRKNPKIILGYSDITALLWAIYNETGLVTFHGPVVREVSGDYGLDSFFRPITSSDHFTLDLSAGTSLVPGRSRGILLGGNLSLICHLIGTPFMPPLDNIILFIEEKAEPLYKIDRMVTHLRLSGVLDHISGLVMGQFQDCGDVLAIEQLFADLGMVLDIPICSGLPVGHSKDNIALPMGLPADLDTTDMRLTILESGIGESV